MGRHEGRVAAWRYGDGRGTPFHGCPGRRHNLHSRAQYTPGRGFDTRRTDRAIDHSAVALISLTKAVSRGQSPAGLRRGCCCAHRRGSGSGRPAGCPHIPRRGLPQSSQPASRHAARSCRAPDESSGGVGAEIVPATAAGLIAAVLGNARASGNRQHDQTDESTLHVSDPGIGITGISARKFSQPPPRLPLGELPAPPVVPVDVQPAVNAAAKTAARSMRKLVMRLTCARFTRASTGRTSQVR